VVWDAEAYLLNGSDSYNTTTKKKQWPTLLHGHPTESHPDADPHPQYYRNNTHTASQVTFPCNCQTPDNG